MSRESVVEEQAEKKEDFQILWRFIQSNLWTTWNSQQALLPLLVVLLEQWTL